MEKEQHPTLLFYCNCIRHNLPTRWFVKYIAELQELLRRGLAYFQMVYPHFLFEVVWEMNEMEGFA